jgi:hypothetical protein
MARRSLVLLPLVVAACGIGWGLHGALSSALALALVVANLAAAAALLSWTARISLALVMVGALGGFVLRLAVIATVVLAVEDQPWVALVPLCMTLVAAHLGLLAWETRRVSMTLAFPSLKPPRAR